MRNLIKLQLLFGLLFVLPLAEATLHVANLHAQDTERSRTANQRLPPDQAMAHYYTLEDYSYEEENNLSSWTAYLKDWLLGWIKRIGIKSSHLLMTLIFAGAVALVWLVIVLTNAPVKGLFIFSRNSALVTMALKSESEINNPELEKMLELFIQHKAYREAIRVHYLLMLKQMNDLNLIIWDKQKTNRDYQKELRNHELLLQFNNLTHHYEYSWYGHFMVDDLLFQSINQQFSEFKRATVQ